MKIITVSNTTLQFDSSIGVGSPEILAAAAIAEINAILASHGGQVGNAQISCEQIRVEETEEPCGACGSTGILLNPSGQIEKCDACDKYSCDQEAWQAATPQPNR